MIRCNSAQAQSLKRLWGTRLASGAAADFASRKKQPPGNGIGLHRHRDVARTVDRRVGLRAGDLTAAAGDPQAVADRPGHDHRQHGHPAAAGHRPGARDPKKRFSAARRAWLAVLDAPGGKERTTVMHLDPPADPAVDGRGPARPRPKRRPTVAADLFLERALRSRSRAAHRGSGSALSVQTRFFSQTFSPNGLIQTHPTSCSCD